MFGMDHCQREFKHAGTPRIHQAHTYIGVNVSDFVRDFCEWAIDNKPASKFG
jgi:hypothetical protein